jgi:hypothetical protein
MSAAQAGLVLTTAQFEQLPHILAYHDLNLLYLTKSAAQEIQFNPSRLLFS